ncbi:MAG: protein phosphatase, partial [Rhodobacterales bacterium]|nr:protein phosphatase [Rhodobacterales bacterium]
LLCSDGLSGLVEDEEMQHHMTISEPQVAGRVLTELACERGGDDNITTIIALVEDPD